MFFALGLVTFLLKVIQKNSRKKVSFMKKSLEKCKFFLLVLCTYRN